MTYSASEALRLNPAEMDTGAAAPKPDRFADQALKTSATLWFLTAAAGQWVFVLYITAYYMAPMLEKGLHALADTHLPKSYIHGDAFGNTAIAAHLFLAAVIVLCGQIQFIPRIRKRLPALHRWNGRIFLLSVFATGISGLYMVWIRGSVGDFSQHIGISLNAVLIMVFAAMALHHAIAGNIVIHRRWALRLFLAAGGVWFARVGLWLWMYFTGGIGIDFKTFTGPFLTFLAFGQYLIPLAVLELYLYTHKRSGTHGRLAMTAVLLALTIAMGMGIYQASVKIWLPRIWS